MLELTREVITTLLVCLEMIGRYVLSLLWPSICTNMELEIDIL